MKSPFDEQRLHYRPTHVGWRATASKILTGVAAATMLVMSVAFSLIAVAIVAFAILGAGIYFWWRTRDLRRQMRARMETATRNEGVVIDGEIIRSDRTDRNQPYAREVRLIDSEPK